MRGVAIVLVLVGCGGGAQAVGYGGPAWVEVEAGEFMMGAPASEPCRRDEAEPHRVAIDHAFSIAGHEVTQAEFESEMGYNPSFNGTCQRCPVESVTWHEAAAYCNAISDTMRACYRCTGREASTSCEPVADCNGYRLPTEAEWEYAARAGSTTALHAGRLASCMLRDEIAEEIGWYKGNSAGETRPIGEKLSNDWGLVDVSGNVAEWTSDAERPHERVLKGGSWYHNADHLRSASRLVVPATMRLGYAGIRCVRTLEVPL